MTTMRAMLQFYALFQINESGFAASFFYDKTHIQLTLNCAKLTIET